MENHQFDKLTKPMTPMQIQKTDADIATIDALNKYTERNNTVLVLSGGYATEALCGGKITRPHGDMDLHMPLTDQQDVTQVFTEIEKIITKEPTKWILRKQTDKKIEFLEDDNKPFFDKRRLELTIHKEDDKPLFTSAYLENTKGGRLEVRVVNINELLASKIHKLYLLKDGVDTSKERHTDDRDIYDLKRLLNLPGYERETVINLLSSRYVNTQSGESSYDVAKKEIEYVESKFQ